MFLQSVHGVVATSVHRGQTWGVVGIDVMILTGVGRLVYVGWCMWVGVCGLVLSIVGWLVGRK